MDKDQKIAQLETIVSQMMKPLRGIPFNIVVKSLSGYVIIPFDSEDQSDICMRGDLREAVIDCVAKVKEDGILSRRANEVGNKMERPVMDAINRGPMSAKAPTTRAGKGKSTGYPDILLYDRESRPTYLEIKTFNRRNVDTTQRSFYLSPSEDFKVTQDARHLLLAFEMEDVGSRRVDGESLRVYHPVFYKIVALEDLHCDVKHEFNSDNKRLYATGNIILEEKV